MLKGYSTVTISDPCSMHHTVRIYPSQDLTLRLSSDIKVLRTDPFIEIVGEKSLKEGTEIHFKQKAEIIDWGKESSVYLGEIYGETSTGHKFRLCVHMMSDNDYKKDVVTVYNPVDQIIKVEPYQILEVVLSDPYFGGSDVWDIGYRDESRELDVGFHQLGKRDTSLARSNLADSRDESDIYHLKARTKSFFHPCCREHHLWFRFDNRILPLVRTRPNNVYFVGNIDFTGFGSALSKDEDLKAQRSLQVWLNIKNKHAHKVAQVLGVRDFGDVSERPDSKVFLPIATPTTSKRSSSKSYSSTRSYGGGRQSWYGEGYDYNTYTVKKSVREIDVEEVENPVLGVNCKAKSLIPIGRKKSVGLIPYDWSKDDDDDTILDHIEDDDDTETLDLGTLDLTGIDDLEAT
jgi:hypothetical protein